MTQYGYVDILVSMYFVDLEPGHIYKGEYRLEGDDGVQVGPVSVSARAVKSAPSKYAGQWRADPMQVWDLCNGHAGLLKLRLFEKDAPDGSNPALGPDGTPLVLETHVP